MAKLIKLQRPKTGPEDLWTSSLQTLHILWITHTGHHWSSSNMKRVGAKLKSVRPNYSLLRSLPRNDTTSTGILLGEEKEDFSLSPLKSKTPAAQELGKIPYQNMYLIQPWRPSSTNWRRNWDANCITWRNQAPIQQHFLECNILCHSHKLADH